MACQLMAAGDATGACMVFEEFDQWYGEEPQTQVTEFREKRLRMWGLACLQAGYHEKGQELIEEWLEAFPPESTYHAFLRFQLASSHAFTGNMENSVSHWRSFIDEHPDLPEAALVHWKLADFFISKSDWTGAEPHLNLALHHPRMPTSGKVLVKAALALLELARGQDESALEWLASMERGSELAKLWQGILAPSLASGLLASEKPREALNIAAWFSPPRVLEQRILDLLQTDAKTNSNARQLVWNTHWRQKAALIEASISKTLSNNELETSQYRLKLRALRRSQMHYHCLVLAKSILASKLDVAQSLRSTAFCEAIESCHVFKDWIQAEYFVEQFLEAYPDHPDLPEILFLQAKGSAGTEDYQAALHRVRQVIRNYPEHRSSMKWKLSEASWTLQSGKAQEAAELYASIEDACPDTWIPFVKFQLGRCKESLNQTELAIRLYHDGFEHGASTPALQEQALLAILKLQLKVFNTQAFEKALKTYRDSFPDGLNRLAVEIMAAMFLQQAGQPGKAVKILLPYANQPTEGALQAYALISDIHRGQNEMGAFVAAAKRQLSLYLDQEIDIPKRPLKDLLEWQSRTGSPALDSLSINRLMDCLNGTGPDCPGLLLLRLIIDHWQSYTSMLHIPDSSAEEWLEARAAATLVDDNKVAYATFCLFLADLLDQSGRNDSADARRIHVLQSVNVDSLDEHSAGVVALTAARYSFPQADALLEGFLQRFPQSEGRPDILLGLAKIRRSENLDTVSIILLKEICKGWPDSQTFPQACIMLAECQANAGRPEEALATLDVMLERGDLDAKMIAEAVLLRAQLYFSVGDKDKGMLNCQRLLQLYPAFEKIIKSAEQLLNDNNLHVDV